MSDLISRQSAIDATELLIKDLRKDTVDVMNFGHNYNHGVADAIATIKHLPSAERWIPVTEGLPRECERVIGYMAWKAMTAIEYQHGRWYSIDHLEPLPDEAVTHWMPLPQPPKEGDE